MNDLFPVVVENLEKYWATEKIDGLTVVADERPVSCCAFCPDGKSLITAGWTGRLKIWSLPECSNTLALKAHEERITGIAANPEFGTAHFYGPAFATGSADHTLRVWNSEGSLITTFSEHCERLGHVAFHPSGRLLASASFDHSWCIWSMEKESLSLSSKTQIEKKYKKLHLQVHENHGKPIYSIAFHPDGCLLGSGGMDSNGRLWDIRTGNNVVALEGHSCAVLTLAFSPNGYHLVTGSMDNTCQLWDLRKTSNQMKILAHKNLISNAKYHYNGEYIVTASYDNELKIWSGYDFDLLKVLRGHENKVMCLDIHPYLDIVASVSYDRMLKLWAPSVGNQSSLYSDGM